MKHLRLGNTERDTGSIIGDRRGGCRRLSQDMEVVGVKSEAWRGAAYDFAWRFRVSVSSHTIGRQGWNWMREAGAGE